MKKTIAAATTLAALALPGAAGAHVTLQPKEAKAGGFTRMDIRVPNERDDAGTRRVSVKMPPGFFFASYEPQDGWTARITRRPLDEPVEVHGEQMREEVDTITFTARSSDDVIEPGQFRDFGLSVGVPEGKAGTKLTFPSTQTYEGGEVVRWIGAPDTDEPAPQVTLTAAEDEEATATTAEIENGNAQGTPSEPAVTAEDVDGKASQGLAIAGLVVAGLGLAAGVGGFAAGRRRHG
jgi:periplasmic copper chaperone A